jgi:hypothetical protein
MSFSLKKKKRSIRDYSRKKRRRRRSSRTRLLWRCRGKWKS